MKSPESSGVELEKLPVATHAGPLELVPGVVISCAVLEDGTRVLSQGSVLNAIGKHARPKAGQGATFNVDEVPAFLAAKSLQPFLSHELLMSTKPVRFIYPENGITAFGYRAEVLPDVCEVYLQARDAEALHYTQIETANRCEILIRALAKVGIVALVDEATGYQYARARNALETLLTQWINKDLTPWLKTFPDEYYIELYRLRGWQYDEVVPRKRPGIVGHITNDIVYSRLAPYIKDALKEVTPRNEKNRPTRKYFQSLTPDHGQIRLREHLDSVVTLMKISPTWNQFLRHLAKAKPVQDSMEQVLFPDDVEIDTQLGTGDISRAQFDAALRKVVGKA